MDLFVSDLDGTLMCNGQGLSEKTITIINRMIDKGLNFTIATARSYESAANIIAPLNLKLPIILNNGVFIYKPGSIERIFSNYMDTGTAAEVLGVIAENGLSPFVFTMNQESENKAWYKGIFNYGEQVYISDRLKNGDKRFRIVDNYHFALTQGVYNIVCIGGDNLENIYRQLKVLYDLNYHYYRDIYSNVFWLEMTSPKASKRSAVEFLKSYLKVDSVTCFGDNLNDLSMFEVADYGYAVDNSEEELKRVATGVIGSNVEDGVAVYLEKYFASQRNLPI